MGEIYVVPRTDIKRHLENRILGEPGRAKNVSDSLYDALINVFDIPRADGLEIVEKSDLGLDIVVPHHQLGDIFGLELGGLSLAGFWRPKIDVSARVFKLHSGKTVRTETVRVKMPWREFSRRALSWRGLLGLAPMFEAPDLEKLLCEGCLELLTRLEKVI